MAEAACERLPAERPAGQTHQGRPATVRRVRNRHILLTVLRGLVEQSIRDPRRLRSQLVKNLWIEIKRFSAPHLVTAEAGDVAGSPSPLVLGDVSESRYCQLVLAAVSRHRGCRNIFEFGTFRGETAWLLANNNPSAHVYTLDLPGPEALGQLQLEATDPEYFDRWERGTRFRGTPEASRITQLYGDSATFDFTPYDGQMDLVFVDASHSYSYVRSDSEAALKMIRPEGAIVWDDYTYYPGIYAYLNELSPRLNRPVEHILGTRLAIYRRTP
jgi:predicted O-methyltransferase YrrM